MRVSSVVGQVLPRRPDQSAARIPYEKRAGFPPSLSVTRRSDASSLFFEHRIFSRDAAILYERVSVRWSVGPLVRQLVTLSFFGLLGATYAVLFGLVSRATLKDRVSVRNAL